jgi:hypothetical protein
MGLLGWLFLLFLFLKLNPGGNFDTPVEDWSWWWVTAPLWGGLVLLLVVLAVVGVVWLVARAKRKRRQREFQDIINKRTLNRF